MLKKRLIGLSIMILGLLSGIGYAANVQTWQQGWLPSNGIDGISMLDLGVKTGGSGKGTARGMVYAGNALYITNQSEGTVAKCEIRSDGSRGTCVKNYIQGIQNPYAITKSPDDKYLYVLTKGLNPSSVNQGGNILYRFTISGWFKKLDPATAPQKDALPNTYQIAADSDGYVYIPDYLNKRIVRVKLNDDGSSTRGNYNISVAFPRGASIGEDGNLYVYNDAGQIAQLNKSNFTTVASYTGNFQDKFGIDVALRGIYAKNANEIWISNQGGSNGQNTIHKVSLTGNSVTAYNATNFSVIAATNNSTPTPIEIGGAAGGVYVLFSDKTLKKYVWNMSSNSTVDTGVDELKWSSYRKGNSIYSHENFCGTYSNLGNFGWTDWGCNGYMLTNNAGNVIDFNGIVVSGKPSNVKQIISRSDGIGQFILQNDGTVLIQNRRMGQMGFGYSYYGYGFKSVSSYTNFEYFCGITNSNDMYCSVGHKANGAMQNPPGYAKKVNDSGETVTKIMVTAGFYCYINNSNVLKCKTPVDTADDYGWRMMGDNIDFTMNNVKAVSSGLLGNELYILTTDSKLYHYSTWNFSHADITTVVK